MEKNQPAPLPNRELVDPKPPVVRCGHMESRKQH